MCRLGFISTKEKSDFTNTVKVTSTVYGNTNDDGIGIALYDGKESRMWKEPVPASTFWLDHPQLSLVGTAVIFHCRTGTKGGNSVANTHPFSSDAKKYMLVHNGVLSNTTDAEKDLKEQGCVFSSQVDSEVILHAWEKKGNEFVKYLNEKGVTGSMSILIMENNGTIYGYTNNGDLVFYTCKTMIMGFSDDKFYEKAEKIKEGTLYTIKAGKVVKEDEVGKLKTFMSTGGNYPQTKSSARDYDPYGGYGFGTYGGLGGRWKGEQYIANSYNDEEKAESASLLIDFKDNFTKAKTFAEREKLKKDAKDNKKFKYFDYAEAMNFADEHEAGDYGA